MSPLLDALRRAEEERRIKENKHLGERVERRQSQLSSRAPVEALSLAEPAPPAALEVAVAPSPSPPIATVSSSMAIEDFPPLDMERILAAANADRSRSRNRAAASVPLTKVPPPESPPERDAARTAFAATPRANAAAKSKATPAWLPPVIAVALTVLGGGGWYVWNEINRPARPFVAATPRPIAPLTAAAATTGQIGGTAAPSADGRESNAASALPPLLPPVAAGLVERPRYAPAVSAKPLLSPREALAKTLKDVPIAPEAAVGLRLAASPVAVAPNPELVLAYQTLLRGDFPAAEKQYAKLVQAEADNIDAQLGLATANARGGNAPAAAKHYRLVLALDPRNTLAMTGLLALAEGAPAANLEIELKTLIGRNPEAAPLHFSLGNLYASQQRWTEAQQAYFEAFRVEPNNADFLFNLAVSLDHLRQNRLALEYYRKAEAAVKTGGGGQFDRRVVLQRIAALSSAPATATAP